MHFFPCSIAIEREWLWIPFWYIGFLYSKVLFVIWRPNFLCGFLLVIFVTKAFSGSVKWPDRGVMLICQVWQVSNLWELWLHQKNKRFCWPPEINIDLHDFFLNDTFNLQLWMEVITWSFSDQCLVCIETNVLLTVASQHFVQCQGSNVCC